MSVTSPSASRFPGQPPTNRVARFSSCHWTVASLERVESHLAEAIAQPSITGWPGGTEKVAASLTDYVTAHREVPRANPQQADRLVLSAQNERIRGALSIEHGLTHVQIVGLAAYEVDGLLGYLKGRCSDVGGRELKPGEGARVRSVRFYQLTGTAFGVVGAVVVVGLALLFGMLPFGEPFLTALMVITGTSVAGCSAFVLGRWWGRRLQTLIDLSVPADRKGKPWNRADKIAFWTLGVSVLTLAATVAAVLAAG